MPSVLTTVNIPIAAVEGSTDACLLSLVADLAAEVWWRHRFVDTAPLLTKLAEVERRASASLLTTLCRTVIAVTGQEFRSA
jgi:hypothetical protein